MPPLAACRAAHKRVSSGRAGSGARSGCGAAREHLVSRRRIQSLVPGPHKIDAADEILAIDHDLDRVAVAQLAERTAGQRLGPDVADARAGAHARKTRVGHDRHFVSPGQMLKRRGDLINLLHARPERSAAR